MYSIEEKKPDYWEEKGRAKAT